MEKVKQQLEDNTPYVSPGQRGGRRAGAISLVEPVTVTKKEEEIAQKYIKKNFGFDIDDINHCIDQELAK